MGKRESGIQSRIRDFLNGLPVTKCLVIHGSPYVQAGTPDTLTCRRSKFYVIEVKNEDGILSDIQIRRLREWFAAGALCAAVQSVAEVKEIIKRADKDFLKTRWELRETWHL